MNDWGGWLYIAVLWVAAGGDVAYVVLRERRRR